MLEAYIEAQGPSRLQLWSVKRTFYRPRSCQHQAIAATGAVHFGSSSRPGSPAPSTFGCTKILSFFLSTGLNVGFIRGVCVHAMRRATGYSLLFPFKGGICHITAWRASTTRALRAPTAAAACRLLCFSYACAGLVPNQRSITPCSLVTGAR